MLMDKCYNEQKTNNESSQPEIRRRNGLITCWFLKILLISAKRADVDLLQHLGKRKGK